MLVYSVNAKHAEMKWFNGRKGCVDVFSGPSNRSNWLGNTHLSVTLIAGNKAIIANRCITCVISVDCVQNGETILESKAEWDASQCEQLEYCWRSSDSRVI